MVEKDDGLVADPAGKVAAADARSVRQPCRECRKATTLLSAASTSLPDIESCVLVAGFAAVVTMKSLK